MASVQSCTLQRSQGSTTFDERNFGHYVLKYDVVTDGVLGHRALANGATSSSPHALPNWGDTYSFPSSPTDTDTAAFAQRFTVESNDQHQQRYVITVNFDPAPEGDDTQFEPVPFDRGPIVWADRETFTRIIERDQMGDAIVNKCGRQYDIPYEEEDTHGVLVVEFNVASLLVVTAMQRFLRRSVNSSTWTFLGINFPPRTVKSRDCSASPPIIEGIYSYYHVVCRFVVADGDPAFDEGNPSVAGAVNWDVPYLERGYQYFKKDAQNVFEMDADGNKALFPPGGEPEPVNLDEDGTKLPDGQEGVFTSWRVSREVDYNFLPFSDVNN